jgi:hypothetical protein
LPWLDFEPFGQALDRAEGQVPFAAFDGAKVGAVDAEDGCEALLREATLGR